ncbi:restriction endonuclease subunit S [Staphylococcus aureus]|nr:restriction endonuclease subunit S [Staphylococcus aureus]UXT30517.1 restriction endonuclease subunit S [Staphylococcus aureus]UXU15473.1 restriction endonuclease subunit S [Staphylococcus aureus]
MEYKLQEVFDIHNSKRIPLSKMERNKQVNKSFPYYGAQGIIDYVEDFLFNGEYLLVAEDGENLKTRNENIAQVANGKFWVNNHAHILSVKENFNTYYLLNKLNSMDISGYLTGTVQPKLSRRNLEQIRLNLPDKHTQDKIGNFILKLINKLQVNQKIIANLEELSQTLFKRWFVDFEFPDENGNPYKSSGGEMVDSELGKIPKYWKVSNLDKIASFVSRGITPKYNENSDIQIPIINQKVNKGPRLDLQYIKYFDGQNRIKKELYAQKNDLLLNSLGQGTLGRIHLFTRKSEEFLIDQHISIIRFDNINYSYFYYAHINTDLIQGQIDSLISGSTGMLMLNITKIRNLKVILPTEELVLKYSELVNEYFGKITQLIYENENLTQLRDTLLPKLMSGEIEIPDDIEVMEDELSI